MAGKTAKGDDVSGTLEGGEGWAYTKDHKEPPTLYKTVISSDPEHADRGLQWALVLRESD